MMPVRRGKTWADLTDDERVFAITEHVALSAAATMVAVALAMSGVTGVAATLAALILVWQLMLGHELWRADTPAGDLRRASGRRRRSAAQR